MNGWLIDGWLYQWVYGVGKSTFLCANENTAPSPEMGNRRIDTWIGGITKGCPEMGCPYMLYCLECCTLYVVVVLVVPVEVGWLDYLAGGSSVFGVYMSWTVGPVLGSCGLGIELDCGRIGPDCSGYGLDFGCLGWDVGDFWGLFGFRIRWVVGIRYQDSGKVKFTPKMKIRPHTTKKCAWF